MPGFLSPRKGMPLLLIPEYSGINKGQRIPDRSKTAHRKPFVQCFLTAEDSWSSNTCLFEVSSSSDSFARIVPVGSTGDFNPGVTHLQLEIIKLSGPGWCRARHHSTVHQSSLVSEDSSGELRFHIHLTSKKNEMLGCGDSWTAVIFVSSLNVKRAHWDPVELLPQSCSDKALCTGGK